MAKKMSASKKILIAAALVAVVLVGVIVSLVVVLASQSQLVGTSITISYKAEGANGNVKFSYMLKGGEFTTPIESTFMGAETSTNGDLSPTDPITMSARERYIVLKYEINAKSGTGYYVSLEYRDNKVADNNATVSYAVSGSEVSDFEGATSPLVTTAPVGTIVANSNSADDTTTYLYVKVAVASLSQPMNYDGGFVLNITKQEWVDRNFDESTGISYGYVENQGGNPYAVAVGYSGSSPSVSIDKTSIYGSEMPVVAIGENAFAANTSALATSTQLSSITLSSNVTKIGDRAFANNTGIEEFIVPSSVTYVGKNIFEGCTSLTNLTCPLVVGTSLSQTNYLFGQSASIVESNLTSTTNGIAAIKPAEQIKEIVIPSTTTLSANNLAGFTSLEKLEFPYAISGAFYTLFGNSVASIPSTLTEIKINGGTIPTEAFLRCSTLTKIVISETVTSIEYYPFYGCSSLTEITLPYLFSRFYELFDGTIPTSLKTVNLSTGTEISSSAFEDCTSITSVTLPNTVQTIGESAFRDCTSLISVSLPSGLQTIREDAFHTCSSLESIVIPDSVTDIGCFAFSSCSGLTSIQLPTGISVIEDHLFTGCTSLESITIPSNVTQIKEYAFYNCTNLNSVVVEGDKKWYHTYGGTDQSGVNIDMSDASQNATYIKTYSDKEFVRGELEYFVISNNVITSLTDAGRYAETIVVPEGIIGIGDYVFQECRSLISVSLPSTLQTIGRYAFLDCNVLTSITIEGGTNWYYSDSSNGSDGTNIDLSDASANATYFTSTYYHKYFFRGDAGLVMQSEIVDSSTRYYVEMGLYPQNESISHYSDTTYECIANMTATSETIVVGDGGLQSVGSTTIYEYNGDKYVIGRDDYVYKLTPIKWDVVGYYTDSNMNTFVEVTDSAFDSNHTTNIVVTARQVLDKIDWHEGYYSGGTAMTTEEAEDYFVYYNQSLIYEYLQAFYNDCLMEYSENIISRINPYIVGYGGSKGSITEKLWVFDTNDMSEFFESNSNGKIATITAFGNVGTSSGDGCYGYWLRDSVYSCDDDGGSYYYVSQYAYYVDSNGSYGSTYPSGVSAGIGVRPAMMINLG